MEDTNIRLQPYLNAVLYKKHESVEKNSCYDYILIHKDGTTVVGCSEFTGRYWNGSFMISKSLEEIKDCTDIISLPSGTNSGCFLGSSDKIAICEDNGSVGIWQRPAPSAWDTTWFILANSSEHDDAVLDIDYSISSENILTVGADANIKIWNLANRLLPVTTYRAAHKKMINSVSSKSDEKDIFVTGSADGYASVWDTRTSQRTAESCELTSGVRCAIWYNNNLLIGTDSGEFVMLDIRETSKPIVVETFSAPIHRIITRDNGDTAVCCDNKTVNVLNLNEEKKLVKIYENDTKHEAFIRGLAFDPNKEDILYTASWDGRICSHKYKSSH